MESLLEDDAGYQITNTDYLEARLKMCKFILEKGRALKMSLKTLHHCVLIMDIFCEQMVDFPISKPGEPDFHNLIASSALLLGSKAGELDERIPFIPKLRKLADMYEFTTAEVKQFEVLIGEKLDWNLQQATFYSFLELYLSSAVLGENDKIDDRLISLIKDKLEKKEAAAEEGVRMLAKEEISRPKLAWKTLEENDAKFSNPKRLNTSQSEDVEGFTPFVKLPSQVKNEIVKVFELYTRDLSNLILRGNFLITKNVGTIGHYRNRS